MKATSEEKNAAEENGAGPGGPPLERAGEPGIELAATRWELSPILLQGQPAGWRVVRKIVIG
jgi:hypothetical protein